MNQHPNPDLRTKTTETELVDCVRGACSQAGIVFTSDCAKRLGLVLALSNDIRSLLSFAKHSEVNDAQRQDLRERIQGLALEISQALDPVGDGRENSAVRSLHDSNRPGLR